MGRVFEKLSDADILVIASPVYFYGVSAQLEALIDRFHSPERNSLKIKGLALLLVGGVEEKAAIKGNDKLNEAYSLGLSLE